MKKISKQIVECFRNGGKLLLVGNGGSAAMAQHLAAEFVCSFENKNRPALPAIALTTDTSIITAYANDFTYDDVFYRQVEALGKTGDILVVLSTSGASKNNHRAIKIAKQLGIRVIEIPHKGKSTADIQERQLHFIHQVCREVERAIFI